MVDARAPRAETFGKADRLRRRLEFQTVQSKGERVHTPHFLAMVLARNDQHRRVGVTVTKKVGNAVARNHVRRVVREIFRRQRSLFPEGADVVIIAKREAPTLGYAEAAMELSKVGKAMRAARARSWEKLRRLDEPEPG